MVIFDFNINNDISGWKITNDTVMGGKSDGQFLLDELGKGVFKGEVSLENNGGFTSVNYQFEQKNIEGFSTVVLKLEGDGNQYQFRIKPDVTIRHSYNYKLKLFEGLQTIEIPLTKLYPIYRGKKLALTNFSEKKLAQITFLIANKKNQSFQLKISSIDLK